MVQQVICKQNGSTDWVNAITTPIKQNEDIRVCLDPRPLNEAINREHVSSSEGLKPDPITVLAIVEFERQTYTKGVQRFLTMVNYQGRNCDNLFARTAP